MNVSEGEASPPPPEALDIPSKTFMSQVEGASGPITATLENKKIMVSTVSMRVAPDLEKLFIGSETEDLELSLATLGFSFEEADLK